jgi:hypothetical protein
MMGKYIAVGVIFVLIVIASYKGLQSDQAKTEVPKSHSEELETPAAISDMPAKPAPAVKMEEKKLAAPIKKAPVLHTEVKERTLSREVNDPDEEMPEEEDDTPTVKRNELIGGANVEWIEPKPREDGDKFGQPPS